MSKSENLRACPEVFLHWMKAMEHQVNALEGVWLGKPYYQSILPILDEAKVPIIRERLIPFARLHNDAYWQSLQPMEIATVDYRHWYYKDDLFFRYVRRLATVPCQALCLGESPYGYEKPPVDIDVFEEKLNQRTRSLVNFLRIKQPQVKIISPAIRRLMIPELKKRYLDYFMHNRSFFDIYAVHCCTETNEHSLGALVAFINEVLTILNKPVWITRWAVPSCEHEIVDMSLNPLAWKPLSHLEAASKLHASFNLINEVADRTKWFYVGAGEDVYHPAKSLPVYFWEDRPCYRPDVVSSKWHAEHFLGSVTYDGEIKTPVLQAFLEIAERN